MASPEGGQPEVGPHVEHDKDDRPLFIHECLGDLIRETLPLGGQRGWTWTPDGGLTPSLHCLECGTHGFWIGGEHPHWRTA